MSTMSSSRLETFSDGVFALAATLLILDVRVGPGELGARLVHNWPSYVAYAVSFLTIGIIWINHHTVFTQVRRVDRLFLLINVALVIYSFKRTAAVSPTGLPGTGSRAEFKGHAYAGRTAHVLSKWLTRLETELCVE